MHDFFSGLAYWRLTPNHALVNSGSLCLTDPGQSYVIYRLSGGSITLDLTHVQPTAAFSAEWLDPRTGARRAAGSVGGGAPRSFNCPDSHDWVLYLASVNRATK
ncbi:MAG: hypothetical protein HYY24_24950 [Verrucomicrobia bacterium]|nr:hypothetical protein [Verrucomicrobiota bacterium]